MIAARPASNATRPLGPGSGGEPIRPPVWATLASLQHVLGASLIALCLVHGGCAGGPPDISPEVIAAADGSAIATLWADWDDLNASIGSGLTYAESAVLDTTSADDRRTWSLVTIDNHTGLLTATRDPLARRDSRGCEHLTLTAALEGSKGGHRAALIVSGAAARLKQLAGVDWAPRK